MTTTSTDIETGDPVLAARARAGDTEALRLLIDRYRPMVWGIAGTRYLPGAERDDLVQEGMVGLWHAVRDFDPDLGPFGPFARLCVDRQMWAAITKANRLRHRALRDATGLEEWMDVADASQDPEVLSIDAVSVAQLAAHIRAALSTLEQDVLDRYTRGESYDDIAEALMVHRKRIDNALQRARRKIQSFRQDQLVLSA